MSETLIPKITDAGIQACFNAYNSGLQAKITHIGLGDESYTPSSEQTQLVNEIQRVIIADGERVSPQQIHVTGVASGEDEYWVKEIGFFLEDGTLLAVWSDNNPLSTLTYSRVGASDGTVTITHFCEAMQPGNYILTCINPATPQAEEFEVKAPDGVVLGTATVGVEFCNQLTFTINPGSGNALQNWDMGDVIIVKVTSHRVIAYKAPNVDLIIGFDLLLTALPADSITVQETDTHLSLAVYAPQMVQIATAITNNDLRHLRQVRDILILKQQVNQLVA
jgi:hypothetical protein